MAQLRRLLCIAIVCACNNPGDGDTTGDTSEPTTTPTTTAPATTTVSTSTTGDSEGPPTTGDSEGAAVRPNWHQDLAPLVTRHCQACHVAGGIAPFAMQTYEETAPWAGVMALDVEVALMPPWHAIETDECQPPIGFKHDARLTDDVKALFTGWADAGAPEGDPALAAPIPEPPVLELEDASVTALMASPVQIAAAGTTRDFFHCLSIDPGNSETMYVDGMQVLAGNKAIVHHVLIYVDAAGASAAWPGGIKPNCGGGAGIPGAVDLIGAWVPGSLPIVPPAGVGTTLPPGTRLILNVHYHATAQPEADSATGLAIRWSTTKPAWDSIFALIGEPGEGDSLSGPLLIPAGATDHVEEYVWVVSDGGQPIPDIVDIRVWAVLNHMHKVGIDMRVWLEDRDSGVETCLVQTPRWDYQWQRSYAYDTPITEAIRVKGGDKVHVRCTYDNSLANPGVQEMLAEVGLDAPVDVTVGEGTLDEMCLTGLGVAFKIP